MIDLDKAKYFIVVGLFLLLLSMGKHYFPDIKNYLGFMWWAGLSSIFLFPIYCHKKTQLPCMIKYEELDGIKNDSVKLKRRIVLERYVSIFTFLVGMTMAVMYLVYA